MIYTSTMLCMTTSYNNQCTACNGMKVAWVELYMD